MRKARERRRLASCIIAATACLITGCPVPIPSGYSGSSRENIGVEVTTSLTKGVTTREDVLLRLGEPDGAAHDGSWLAYGSVYGRGGLGFVVFAGGGAAGGGGEKVEYRRLIVTFDQQGLMTGADFVSRECWQGLIFAGASGDSTPPCLDIAAPNSGPAGPAATTGGK
jgi:hypothetical protein